MTPRQTSDPGAHDVPAERAVGERALRESVCRGILALSAPDDVAHIGATVAAAVADARAGRIGEHALGRLLLHGTVDAVGCDHGADPVVAEVARRLVATVVAAGLEPDDAVSGAVDAVAGRAARLVEIIDSASVEAYRRCGVVRGDRPRAD